MNEGLVLGALALLSGLRRDQPTRAERLWAMSRWNDGVQAWIFDPEPLAPELPGEPNHRPFRSTRFIGGGGAGHRWRGYKLESRALSARRSRGRSTASRACRRSQITRHICVEGWSAIGKWSGVRFSDFLRPDRRRHQREIRRLQMRRRLLHQHRHGHRPASADRADAHASATRSCRANTGFP